MKRSVLLQRLASRHSWFQDDVIRRLVRNSSMLLGGNAASSVLLLLAVVVAARSLGPTLFGVLAVVTTYVAIVDQLLNFQSWQALIKYGATALEAGDREEFKKLVKFGSVLDAGSAAVGTAVAASAVLFVGPALGWDDTTVSLAALYSLLILTNLTGTPIAVLRLHNRFDRFVYKQFLESALRLLGAGAAYLMGGGLEAFLLVWGLSQAAGNLLLFVFGWVELRGRGLRGVLSTRLAGVSRQHPGLWHFVLTTNVHSSVKTTKEFDVIVVGTLLGTAAAGLYKVAKQLSAVLSKVADPVYQSVYPELARLVAKGDMKHLRRTVLRSMMLLSLPAAAALLVALLLHSEIISLTVGQQYLAAGPVWIAYLAAVAIAVVGMPLHPTLLSLGKPMLSLGVVTLSTIAYFAALFVLIGEVGLVGAGLAYIVFYAIWFFLMAAILFWLVRSG